MSEIGDMIATDRIFFWVIGLKDVANDTTQYITLHYTSINVSTQMDNLIKNIEDNNKKRKSWDTLSVQLS